MTETLSLAENFHRRFGLTPIILQRVCLIGGGNPHNKRIIEAIEGLDNQTYALPRFCFSDTIDQNPDAEHFVGRLHDWTHLQRLVNENVLFANTVSGSTKARKEVFDRVTEAGGRFMDFIHPDAPLPAKIGIASYLQGDITIQADVEMGDNCSVHDGAVISHGVRMGNHCFVGAATLLGRSVVADGGYVGAGAVVLPDVKIGSYAIVGAGAIVLKDVPSGATIVGNPGRILKVEPVA